MRVITRGLPLLIVATLLTATPVGAADQGDVGIVDGTVRVVAIATIPGESWGSDNDCVYEVVIEDDIAFGVYEVDGTRMYSDSGRWLGKSCEGEAVAVDGCSRSLRAAGSTPRTSCSRRSMYSTHPNPAGERVLTASRSPW